MARLLRFLQLLFSFGFRRGQIIAKFGPALLGGLMGFALWKTPLYLFLMGARHDFTAGTALLVLILCALLIFRAGDAWTESGRPELIFSGAHFGGPSGEVWIEIENRGPVVTGAVKVWIAAAVNSDGSEGGKVLFPILLSVLSHGILAKGCVSVKLASVSLAETFFPQLAVSGTGASGQPINVSFTLTGFEWADNANRIYLKLSIDHAARGQFAWYEVKSQSSINPHISVAKVNAPLNNRQIRRQREREGVIPDPPSPQSTKH